MPEFAPDFIAGLIHKAKNSAKYRHLDLPDTLLEDLVNQASRRAATKAELEKSFREKLHNVVAPYLETLDYAKETKALKSFIQTDPDQEAWRNWCMALMKQHASTSERLPTLDAFADFLNPYLERVEIVLDLASGLDPLQLPWLKLPERTQFFAYDLNSPRVDFLNLFFQAYRPSASAIRQDILAEPPELSADLGLFFKEAHRFEKREPGCNRRFFNAIKVKTLIVSLPAEDLAGRHSLEDYHSGIIHEAIADRNWQLQKQRGGNELFFIIEKEAGDEG